LKYPDNIKSKKSKMAYWSFKQWYTYSVGRGQIVGRITNMIPEFGWIIVFIEKFTGYNFSILGIITFVLASSFVFWILGFWYMNHSLDEIDQQVSAERNILLRDIHKSTVKKRDKL